MKRFTMFVRVFSLIIFVFSVMMVSCALSSCDGEHSGDHVEIYGKSIYKSDNMHINIPEGYFLVDFDKSRIDDTHLDLVLHFSSNDNGDGWD